MTRTHHVRLGLLAVGTLLALLVTIQPGHSQPGPPGGIRGGPPFGPPAMPGPPGGIGGRPPGFPEMPRPPQFPQPPVMPQPPGFGGGVGIGGGIGGGGPTIYTWRCGRCGRVLGTGPNPPATAFCPVCRVENVFPGVGGGMPGGVAPPPGAFPPGAINPPAGNAPPPPIGPLDGDADLRGQPEPPPAPATNLFVPSDPPPASSPRASVLRVVGITLGMLLLLAVGIAGVVIALLKDSKSPRRQRPRRRRRYDDDDY